MAALLEGIRVLDFGRVVASALCGTLLADMGAEVIKVERPGGEFDRALGPLAPDGSAITYSLFTPRNKKSITLDTRHPRGKEILDKLVANSQILISGFTSKGNEMMGLDYARLKQVNPAIIQVAVSGYGQEGVYADRPAFDSIAQAESGAMSYTGFPGCPPTRSAVPYVDYSTGILAALGAVLALRHLDRTGSGQLVDVSLLSTAIFCVAGSGVMAEYNLNGQIREPIGNSSFYTYSDAFQARDGWVMINAIGDEIWQRLAKIVGRHEWLEDDRFKDDNSRYLNRHIIGAVVKDWVAQYNVSELIPLLEKNRVPCGRVNTAREVVNDPHVIEREMLVNVHYPGLGEVPMPGLPIKLSETPGKVNTRAPELGQHNEEIFCSLLGYSREDFNSLRHEGAI
ncbi:MAG: CoA transferase [Syntrophobacteraceae bacterium]